MSEYPQKKSYKLNEVCQYTDTQPYVLRFWESEFPQLSPARGGSGQPVYRSSDIDLVRRIKQLLYEEDYTLEGARKQLAGEAKGGGGRSSSSAKRRKTTPAASSATEALREAAAQGAEEDYVAPAEPESAGKTIEFRSPSTDGVSRQRYEDAIDEIDHLRLQVKESEKGMRKAEAAMTEAEERAERYRVRLDKAGSRIEKLLDGLS